MQAASSGQVDLDLPTTLNEAVAIVSNKRRVRCGQEVKAAVALQEQGAAPPILPPDDGEQIGCSCDVGGGAGDAWVLLFFLLCALGMRRGRLK